jgi:hypothetical protein
MFYFAKLSLVIFHSAMYYSALFANPVRLLFILMTFLALKADLLTLVGTIVTEFTYVMVHQLALHTTI